LSHNIGLSTVASFCLLDLAEDLDLLEEEDVAGVEGNVDDEEEEAAFSNDENNVDVRNSCRAVFSFFVVTLTKQQSNRVASSVTATHFFFSSEPVRSDIISV
jgi:hypothetical protein